MRRYLITAVGLLLVLAVVWDSFAQEESSDTEPAATTTRPAGSSQRGAWREQQVKAAEMMQEQAAKIKAGLEAFSGARQSWREMSEDERNELREKYTKAAEERRESLKVIEEQVAKLKGSRALREENEKVIEKLKAIRQVAEGEQASKTVEAIDKLIAEKKEVFEAKLKELGIPERSRRR